MNPLGTRAAAEELARLLEGGVAAPGSAAARSATLARRLRMVAASLDSAATPRPDFRAALRQRLVAVATVQAVAEVPYAEPAARPKALDAAVSWSQSRRAQRRLGLTAGAMAGVIGFTGVAVASSQSLPGQPFYGLKRTAEDVQLSFASGDTAKGTKHLEFASTRLREVRALTRGDGKLSIGPVGTTPVADGLTFGRSLDSKLIGALEDFDRETNSGQELLEKVYRSTGKPEPLRVLKSFSAQQQSRLSDLLPQLPAAVQDEARDSLALVVAVGSSATELLALGTCGGECYPGNAGPTPAAPVPAPGATATPSGNNGVPSCDCGQPTVTPRPTPAPEPTPSTSPSPEPTRTPSPEPSPTQTSQPNPLPTLPVPLPTLPVPLPTLPVPLPTILPTLLPGLLPKS